MARPPAFWFNPPERPGWQARLLAPLGWLYAAATARRLAAGRPVDPGVPVICVGNINAGGTGKTPVVIALAQRLTERGQAVHIVSRGHGGRLEGPVRVDPRAHSAADTGDEPLLLSAFAPVWVSRDRAAGCIAAAAAGAGVILLDDGHQNPGVAKALSLVVIDAAAGFGNGRCLPAGPLREPADTGLARADLVVLVGAPPVRARFLASAPPTGAAPVLAAEIAPLATGMDWSGARVLAFAGIGQPAKFFDTLRRLGAEVVHAEALDDHQPLTPALMHRLASDAERLGAQLVTTEKDAVRLPQAYVARVLSLPVRLVFADPAALDRTLDTLGL